MKHTRRTILRKASALSALAVGASGTAAAADCTVYPAWDETTLYYAGDRAHHPDSDGIEALWEAAYDSRNAEPSRNSTYWNYVGDCDGSGGGGGNDSPSASASASPTTVTTGETVNFDGSASSDPDGSIGSYDWDFGDGSTGSGVTTSHSYSSTGTYTATLTVTDDGGATDSDSVSISVEDGSGGGDGDGQSPYGQSTPRALPGRIQAQHYDTGGEGVAYHDTTSGNSGGAFRSEDVDIEAASDSTGGSYNVGWIADGEWLEYTVSVDSSGTYDVDFRVASNGGGGAFHLESGGTDVTGTLTVGDTGGWQNWTTVTATDVSLNAGEQVVRIAVESGGFNVNWFEANSAGSGNEAPTASFTTSPSAPAPGETVTFDASGSSDSDGSITSYDWDFGDGTTGSGQSVTHTYSSAGDYTVTLTVTDDAGATGSNSTTVSVDSGSSGGGGSVFAPYNHMTTQPGTSLVDHASQAGNDQFTLAFVLSDGNANAAWDGEPDQLVGDAGMAGEIQEYQNSGGTVIISFGGAVGTMIAQDTSDIEKIKSEYRNVVETYGVTHLDFDIESVDEAAVDRRNQALTELQQEMPDLKASYTLRCRTTGLTSHGQYIVENAKSHGVDLEIVNIMTMNYGWVRPSASTIKDSANGTHSDLSNIFPGKSSAEIWSMVGITPMIGENNAGGAHYQEDAREVASFVQNNGIGLVSFWSIDRDNGGCPDGSVSATCSGISQDLYEFSHIYNQVQ